LFADAVREAGLVAFYVPMHTATRLTSVLAPRIREINPDAHLCAFGLYAPMSEPLLRELGIDSIIGGEFEPALVVLAERLSSGAVGPVRENPLERLQFLPPDRSDLPPLARYSRINIAGASVVAGYTEASRGCKHLCRHCPVVPVYNGAFRVVQPEVVLDDVRTQAAAGARHITFGDPDFFNGPTHARRIVEAFHREFPDLTYDVTIKVEHLLNHADLLPVLRDTGQMVFLQFAEKVRLPMIVMLNKDGKVAGPATFGMQSQPENYKADIRARLNKLLRGPSADAGTEAENPKSQIVSLSEREGR